MKTKRKPAKHKTAKETLKRPNKPVTGTTTFCLYAQDHGDPSTGIHPLYGPITVTIPDCMIDRELSGEFERDMATFMSQWVPDGTVLTSWEKAEEDALCDVA